MTCAAGRDEVERHDLHDGDYVDLALNKLPVQPTLPRDVRAACDRVRAKRAEGIHDLAER